MTAASQGGGLSWTPANLGASLLGYYDAENAASVPQSAGAVTTWTDTVSGCAPTQATAGSKPVWSATSFNSRPGVTFDGVDDRLYAATHTYPVGTTAHEMWVLCSQGTLNADASVTIPFGYGFGAGSAAAGSIFERRQSGGVSTAYAIRANITSFNTSAAFNGIHIVRGIFTTTTGQCDLDGVAGTPSSEVLGIADSNDCAIGAFSGSALFFFNGVINKILVTNPLSAGQAASLTAYLKAIGGIA